MTIFTSLFKRVLLFSEVHPLLGVKGDGKSKKKTAGRPKGSKGKDKDFPFRPKPYKGDQPSLSVETLSGSGVGGGGGMKGRTEGGLATGKYAPAAGSCADTGCLRGNPPPPSPPPCIASTSCELPTSSSLLEAVLLQSHSLLPAPRSTHRKYLGGFG